MKSRGLGDDIEKFTKFTGIKKAVDIVAEKLNKDCGCSERRDGLNRMFPKTCCRYKSLYTPLPPHTMHHYETLWCLARNLSHKHCCASLHRQVT